MKIFSELEKLGYKKYNEKSFEELDELPFDSKEITIEKSFVFKWFRDLYSIYCNVDPSYNANNKGFSDKKYFTKNNIVFIYSVIIDENNINAGVSLSYEQAEHNSIVEVINILMDKLTHN